MFDKILENAKSTKETINEVLNKQEELGFPLDISINSLEDEANSIKSEGTWIRCSTNAKDSMCNARKEALDAIKNTGAEILEYWERVDEIPFEEYDAIFDYFVLEKNNYRFIVTCHDCDDFEDCSTVLFCLVHRVTDLVTNEIFDFFVDLNCRNTGIERFNAFMLLLNSKSKEEYLSKRYAIYEELPELLEKNGVNVVKNTLKYYVNRIEGFIKLDDQTFIVPYDAWHNDIKMVVTNKKKWDVNQTNNNNHNVIGYYLNDYKSSDDIDYLLENIKAYKKHINKELGFKENGKYYENRDVDRIFDNLRINKDGEYVKAFNERVYNISRIDAWDGRGYGDHPYINKYNGLEIARHYTFSITPLQVPYINNESDIVFKYDTSKDKDNCILLINNYQVMEEQELRKDCYHDPSQDDEEEIPEYFIDRLYDGYNEDVLIGSIEFKGTFEECANKLDEYLKSLLDAFGIDYKN